MEYEVIFRDKVKHSFPMDARYMNSFTEARAFCKDFLHTDIRYTGTLGVFRGESELFEVFVKAMIQGRDI